MEKVMKGKVGISERRSKLERRLEVQRQRQRQRWRRKGGPLRKIGRQSNRVAAGS
jgi:hypothetical protein